jgi:hypothetical protein
MTAAARPDPLRFLDAIEQRYGVVPCPQALEPLSIWLRKEGYTPIATREIVEHAARWGTVQCCAWLDPGDLDRAEEQLPDADPATWTAGAVLWFATPTMASPDETYP